jgi:hypothetical protein
MFFGIKDRIDILECFVMFDMQNGIWVKPPKNATVNR